MSATSSPQPSPSVSNPERSSDSLDPVRPGWIEIGAGAVGFGVMYLITFVVLHAIPDDHGVASGLAAYGFSALSGLVAFLAALLIRIRKPSVFGLRAVKGRWLWAGAGFGLVAFVLSAVASYLFVAVTGNHTNTQTGYGAAATGGVLALVGTLLLGAVATPIGEELAFRGVLTNALGRYGAWVAVLGSAAVFALTHGINPVLPVAFVEGVIAALLFRRTGSIWPGVLVHLVNNGLSTVLSVLSVTLG